MTGVVRHLQLIDQGRDVGPTCVGLTPGGRVNDLDVPDLVWVTRDVRPANRPQPMTAA